MRPSTFKSLTISSLAIGALAVGIGLLLTESNSRAQQQKEKGKAPAPIPALLQNYPAVTAERLKNPADSDWLMIRRTYNGWGYSPLNQINATNVSKLRLVWSTITGESRVHEAAPLVNGGAMFISTPNGQVIALDAKTGDILWRYRRARPQGAVILHDVSRGVALYGDKVYYAAGEAVLVALDAKTGRVAWETVVADNKQAYYMSLAPLVAGGTVMVGASGGETGIRGFVAAYDPDNGKELWRTYTIPAPGEPGSETWPKGGEQWKTGGAPVWVTGNYDPETNTAYWGTGNGGPWMGDKRPGDNLYTASTLAIDVATGKLKGHFQYVPNESWDWDEPSPPILVDYQRNGRMIKGLIDVARNGYLWFLDRGDGGTIKFVEGKPYVYQNVFRSLDPVTGRPDVDPAHKPGTSKRAEYCPGAHGGKNWPPIAYSPQTRMVYIPANDNVCGASEGLEEVSYVAGKGYTGVRMGGNVQPQSTDHFGEVQAWNVDTGQRVWTHKFAKSPNWGSMLATGGGLVISGGTNDRKVRAFDAKDGKVLWEFPTSSGVEAPVTTFLLDGKQYLAVLSGWGGDANGMNGTIARTVPGVPSVPEGGSLWVFALE